jgi:hypothetical protein
MYYLTLYGYGDNSEPRRITARMPYTDGFRAKEFGMRHTQANACDSYTVTDENGEPWKSNVYQAPTGVHS